MMKTLTEKRLLKKIEAAGGRWIVTHKCKSERDGQRMTVAAIRVGSAVYIDDAQCSRKDQFNKRTGRIIALGRAFKRYEKHIGGISIVDIAKKNEWDWLKQLFDERELVNLLQIPWGEEKKWKGVNECDG